MEYAAAALDVVDVQVASSAEDLQPAGAIGVPKPHRPVARGGASAVRSEVAEGRVGEAKMHAHDRPGRDASGRLVGLGIDLPGQTASGQGKAATSEAHHGDGSDACAGQPGARLELPPRRGRCADDGGVPRRGVS